MKDLNLGEILSPVGNEEMLFAAVRSGADAVYLGLRDFSARRNAENFTFETLKTSIEYCHIHGVRVYLTLNILIKESELENAFLTAQNAYNLGIDGIIVEDLGLAAILHEKIPELPLHASTQMSIHSPAALPILKDLGFKQVVAAREMSKNDLKEFCKVANSLGITVEVFVHGALCMCVSGQCLLSSFLGSRSGNRGLCAGPCRLPFKAEGGTGYDLSLKDLSMTEYIRELYDLGVRSFKIEGRMKRPEYVATATLACKTALSEGYVDENLSKTLKNVFSRQGFTDGYYTNSLGVSMFGIRTKDDVVSADKEFPKIHEIYRKEKQSVPVDLVLKIKNGEEISLSLSDKTNTVTAKGVCPSKAENKPLSEDSAIKNVTKFGSTPYFANNISIDLDDGLFISAGELNSLRRSAVELLDEKRKNLTRPQRNETYTKNFSKPNSNTKPKVFIRIEDVNTLPKNLDGIDAIIFPLEKNPEDLKDINIPLIADIPRGIVSEKVILERLKLFKSVGFKTALCGNLSAISLAKAEGFEIIGDTGLNIANSESLKTAEFLGAKSAVLSAEELLDDIVSISSPIKKGIIAYGNIPLMLFKNCPLKNGKDCQNCDKKGFLTDRMGIKFPIRCRLGYSELLNSLPIWLADRQKELFGLDFIILYFTLEDRVTVEKVINDYKSGSAPDIKYTRGLYYRGTI